MVTIRDKQLEKSILAIVNNKPESKHFKPLLPDQAKLLKEWNSEMESQGLKPISRSNSIHYLKIFGLFIKKPYEAVDKKDIIEFFNSKEPKNKDIKKQGRGFVNHHKGFQSLGETTKAHYKINIKSFYRWLHNNYNVKDGKLIKREDDDKFYKRGQYPSVVDWIEFKLPSLGHIEKSKLLSWEDTQKLIDATDSVYRKCLLALLRESGARAQELLNVKIKDVEITNIDAIINIPNSKVKKTGKNYRKVLLVDSIKYLRMWLENHPKKDNPNCWLFINMNTRSKDEPEQLGYSGLYQVITKTAKKVFGKDKRFNPHWFRHSAITETSRELSDAEQRERYGWVKSSGMIGRYNHSDDEDVIEKQRLNRGIKIKNIREGDKIKRVIIKECPNCGEENNLSLSEFCHKCHFHLNKRSSGVDAINKIEKENKDLIKSVHLIKEDISELLTIKQILDMPNLGDEMRKLINKGIKQYKNQGFYSDEEMNKMHEQSCKLEEK